MSDIKVIVGLGNPGKKYEKTRHNLGFRTLDLVAESSKVEWKKWNGRDLVTYISAETKVALLKPQQFMNNSGIAVREILEYLKFEPGEILVVVDDFSIPLGTIRFRKSGSDGGHNGLASIIENLGTNGFARIRLGIGPVTEFSDPADFVLSEFSKNEQDIVNGMLTKAADIVKFAMDNGIDKAISKSGLLSKSTE